MKCPTCGRESETCAGSNRPTPYMMEIPREMLPVMIGLFRRMSTSMAMQGYGHVSHMIGDMSKPLREATPDWMLRLTWDPESLAQAIKARRLGHEIVVVEADGKISVVAYEGEKGRIMMKCQPKDGESPQDLIILLENFFESIDIEEKKDD